MPPKTILLPVFALVGLTFSVLLTIPIARIAAVRKGRATISDFKLGESAQVPAETQLFNRNYMNLLELPVLFYVLCLSMYVTGKVDAVSVSIAWIYVALRCVHSLIHLTYNQVVHRLVAFAASNFVLAGLWLRFFLTL